MTQHPVFLSQLKTISTNKKKRNRLLKQATPGQINSIRNLCYNICKKKLKISSETKKRLHPFKKDIRDLANKKKLKTLEGVKNRLIQRGGFLPILLPAVLSLLSTIGGRALSKAIGV